MPHIFTSFAPQEAMKEKTSEDNELSICQQLMTRLEPFKTLPVTTTQESKKHVWLQFVSLWCQVLQMSPSDAQSCYEVCARLLPQLFRTINFYLIRKEAYVARESFFACITQLDQPRIKDYILLSTKECSL